MSEQTHPPYAAGSKTIPRTLIRWLDVNAQNGQLTRTQTFITLPNFNQGISTWNGYSDIVASFNIESPNAFSLLGLSKNVPVNPNYTLTISYRIGGKVTRYLLWDAVGSNLNQNIAAYTGQPIMKNCRFEVWNTSQGVASQTNAATLYTSVAGGQDYRYGTDIVLVNPDTENNSFANTQTVQVVNPFDQFAIPYLGNGAYFDNSGNLEVPANDPNNNILNPTAGVIDLPLLTFNSNAAFSEEVIQGDYYRQMVVAGSYGGFELGHWNGTTLTNAQFTLTISGNSVTASYLPTSKSITINYPTASGEITIAVLSFLSGTTLTLSVYNGSGILQATSSVNTLVVSDFRDAVSNALAIKLAPSCVRILGMVLCGGLSSALPAPQDIAGYFAALQGFQLPLTFPATSVSTTN